MAAHDYEQLLWDESSDLAALLGELDDADFDKASLCDGWRTRDAVAHMILGHTTPMAKMLGIVGIKFRGNVPKASYEMSRRYGSEHTPREITDAWAGVARNHTRKGIARVIPMNEGFVDHLIHHQDIRRPLGRPRTISSERLVAALDALPGIGGFLGSKKRMKGLRWTATDVEWSWGEGPEVRGPGEALILAASGRGVALAELEGDGVTELTARLAQP